jgi:putative ABC transport system permease protein
MSIQRDVDAELRFHFDARIEELMEQGMTREAARAQAVSEFGDVEVTRASLREIDGRVAKRRSRAETIEALLQDLRYSIRSLRRTPAVSLTIILTLALGIGVNAAMFSLLDAIYLRPPVGVVNPNGVHRVWVERRYATGTEFGQIFDYASHDAIRTALDARAQVTAFSTPTQRRFGRGENAPMVMTSNANANYFAVLGAKPLLGRFYTAQEDSRDGGAPVAVVAEAFWRNQLGGDQNVLGKEITIERTKLTIIGVVGGGFRGVDLDAVDVWVPNTIFLGADAFGNPPWYRNPNVNGFQVLVRPASGVPDGEIQQRLTQALRQPGIWFRRDSLAHAELGAINRARGPGTVSTEMRVAERLAAVAIIVLLIACANVVNLLLARAVHRRREIAVRLALGVSRSRLMRLLILESLVLAVAAAIAALIAANWGGAVIRALLMPTTQWSGGVLNWRVLSFALVGALAAGVLAGIVPALQSSTPNLIDGLKAGSHGAGAPRSRLRGALLATQAALSVVLLIGAVLFVRSLRNVKAHDVGYSVDHLVFAGVSFEDTPRDPTFQARFRALEPKIAAIPGVEGVAYTSLRPKYGMMFTNYFPDADTIAHRKPEGMYTAVSPSFFKTTGTKLLRGRPLESNEAGLSVIVNDAMAKAMWPNEDPLGRCIRLDTPESPCATIVGVSQTAILSDLTESPSPHLYISLDRPARKSWGARDVIVRVDPVHAIAVGNALREMIRAEFVGAIPRVTTMSQVMEPQYRPWTLGARLFTLFGILALVVAAIGVYSTVSYAVNQRTHEFGIRIALGARAADVLRHVLGQGLRTVIAGIVVGLVLAIASGRFIAALLYGVAPSDPATMVIVAVTLVAIGALAALVPAWRASRADPLQALRAE